MEQLAERACDKALVRLLPWLLLMYVLAYLDRANLGFAKNAFQASTGISEASYAFGVGIFSVAYASIEIPSNMLLQRFGARLWLSRIMVSWGLVSAAMAFVTTATGFYAVSTRRRSLEARPRRRRWATARVKCGLRFFQNTSNVGG